MIVLMALSKKHWLLPLLVTIAALACLAGVALIVGVRPNRQASPLPAPAAVSQRHQPAKPSVRSDPPPYEFPHGGRELLPHYRFVALYGTPGVASMGVLGEQPMAETIQAVKDMAAQYQPYSAEKIFPTLEIITTVATASPTTNGDYSNELDTAGLLPWIEAAKQAGVYVVLDLQPGRTDFLTQAKLYEQLLREPHVGLALDPEWRLKPDQVHLKQIGSVDVSEVNAVGTWLADVTKQNGLPQKMFLLHQFRLSMITNREQLDTSHKELAYVIQMDGNGAQSTKLQTWRTLLAGAPPAVYFGWKNFYDEDLPMLAPQATMGLSPQPWYISYQ